jgi:colanic acid biosynthesis glycosyl transferase WcaI
VKSVEFWSSVEHGTFQKGLVQALSDSGWDARAQFGVPLADYRKAGSRTERLLLRARTYVSYPWDVVRRFGGPSRGCVGVVCTNTFYAPFAAAFAAGRRGDPVVHWVFDLFPDVLTLAGVFERGSMGERAIHRLVRSTFDRSAANVFLGRRLYEFAEERFGPIPRARVIPIGCDARPFKLRPPVDSSEARPIRILYSGNFGHMHDVETVISALRIGLPEGVDIEFRGNGPGIQVLQSAARSMGLAERIHFSGNLDENEWVEKMCSADVGLVTLRAGAEDMVMPSKTYSAMAAGQAILAVCPGASDLADTIRNHQCGWVIEPGDPEGLAAVWRNFGADRAGVLRRRRAAWDAGRNVYDQEILASSWSAVLEGASSQS